jgi:putative ABC transport system permease protein
LIEEETRDTWTWAFLERLVQDVRYALRSFRDHPGFTLTTTLSLALGLGTSLAIYTVADNLLLRPLPYTQPSRLVMLWEEKPAAQFVHAMVAPRNYFAWKARTDVFEDIAAFDTSHSVLGDGDRSEEFSEITANANLLPMLGVHPILGSLFTKSDDTPGASPVLLISYRLWQSWFGGDRGVVGRKVQFGGTPHTIAGVLPANFYFLDRGVDVWTPLGISAAQNAGDGRWLTCLARLKPNATLRQAQNEMTAIARQTAMDDPGMNKDWTATAEPLRDALVREVKPSLIVLLGAVGLLLAVACANVASLLLARYTARQREIALRASLGAGRARVIRQLLTESLLLAFIGGALGILLAKWAVAGLIYVAPKDLTQSIEIAIDTRVYLFALCLTVLTSIFFGLAPALAGSRGELIQTLQQDSRSSLGGRGNLRSWFVGAEVALSIVLLSGALLLFRSIQDLEHVKPGIDAANLLTLRVSLPAQYQKTPQKVQFFERLIQETQRLPGVSAASAVSHLPYNGMAPGTYVTIEGRPPVRPGDELVATIRTIMPNYFRTMGIPLLEGRDFSEADNRDSAPLCFIVSRTFVRKFLGTSNPLDARIQVFMAQDNPFGRIVGVVDDVRDQTLDQTPTPTVYYPHAHLAYNRMIVVARTMGDPISLAAPIRRIVRSIDPAQPIADIRTMDEVVANTFSRQHFSSVLLAGFSFASLMLAAIGVYGILAYSVSERTREIGIRVAVGATPERIVFMVLRGALLPVLGGVAVGIGIALGLSGLLRSMLFGIAPRDPVTFVLAPVVLACAAMIAAWLPSRRAACLDPTDALRAN